MDDWQVGVWKDGGMDACMDRWVGGMIYECVGRCLSEYVGRHRSRWVSAMDR